MNSSLSARTRRFLAGLWALAAVALVLLAAARGPALVVRLRQWGVHLAWRAQLWWALPALLVPFGALLSLTDLPPWQQALQVAVRMALIGVLAFCLAGPRGRRESPRNVQVIHLVDRSASVPDELLSRASTAILADGLAARRPEDLRVDVVLFDRRARRLPWPATGTGSDEPPTAPELRRDPRSSLATDLEAALNTALGIIEVGRVVHVVIWSDGIETRGDAAALIPTLRQAGVTVHTPATLPHSDVGEVVVERVVVPAILRRNVPFDVEAIIGSTGPARVSCSVRGEGIHPEAVQASVRAGEQRVGLGRIRLRTGGQHELSVRCKVLQGRDRFAGNNGVRTRVVVRARPKVLYVEGARGQARYLEAALESDYDLQTRPASGLPRTLAELKRYSAIILSDLPRVSPAGVPLLTEGDMRKLHAYVEAGGGLLVLGGEDSLGSGGYQGTYLEKKVLPVHLEIESELQEPTIAMILCIDRSGSMQGTKIELAKEAARATAEALGADDRIGVLAFDNLTRAVVRLQRAGNRYRIATHIGRLAAGGGTNIYPCLQQAYDELNTVSARVKHVILLSDGKAPRTGIDGLILEMRRSGMTVTAVGVGTEVDRDLLESIADRGGGRSYFTDRPETLPRIFVRETKEITGESVIERRIRARRAPGAGRIDLLRGIHLGSAPPLLGYLPTRVKKAAKEILRTTDGAPLLVRWRLGIGKVSVWTSDLKNRWAHHWIDWPDYAAFARQLVRDLLHEEVGRRVAVALSRERGRLRLAADAVDEDDRYLRDLEGTATVRLPNGEERVVPLPEIAPGRYETTVPMRQLGPYDVRIALRGEPGRPPLATGTATAVHPYPDEYRLAAPGQTALPALVAATGGKRAARPADWRADQGRTHMRWQWLWPDLLKLALGLLLADLALRRVRLGRARARSWF